MRDNSILSIDQQYPVQTVEVPICGKLYQKWSETSPFYKNIPPEGILTKIEYADTLYCKDSNGREITTESPIVVCLHGAPGSHQDYRHLITDLTQIGHRVIVPNFPTYKMTTKTGVFRHSSQEKKEYIKEFLKSISVTKIEMLVSHSSAIYPSTLLWRDEEGPAIKSIAFISPAGHRRIKAMRPKIVTSVFVRVYQNKLGRQVCRTFGSKVLSITGCPVRPDNMDNVILSATTMVYSKFRKLQESLEMLREEGVPILFILSENDKLVDTDISYEMAGILGAKDANYSIYKNTVCEKKRTCTSYPWIVALSGGGHYSFINYPQVVNGEILQFLDSVNNDRNHHVDKNENVSGKKNGSIYQDALDDFSDQDSVEELPRKIGHESDMIEMRRIPIN